MSSTWEWDKLPFHVLKKIFDQGIHVHQIKISDPPLCKLDYLLQSYGSSRVYVDQDYPKVWVDDVKHPNLLWVYMKNTRTPFSLLQCDRVYSLKIIGIVGLKEYNLLAKHLLNVRHLLISWLNLEVAGNPDALKTFPAVKRLWLGGVSLRHKQEQLQRTIADNLPEGTDNFAGLISLLESMDCPQLREFNLTVIVDPGRENLFVDALLTFLTRHAPTLRKLDIQMTRQKISTTQEICSAVPDFERRLDRLGLKIKCFLIHFYPYIELKSFLRLIDHISSTQVSLKSSLMLFPRYRPVDVEVLEDNFRTLTSVACSIQLINTFDCQVFQKCSSLNLLFLHAQPKDLLEFETANYLGKPAVTQLTNMNSLPKTLTTIELVNFFMETKDTAQIKALFPELKFLRLIGIGEKENLGFTMQTFSRLAHSVNHIGVYRGFNRASMQVSEADDPKIAFMKIKFLTKWQLSGKDHLLSLGTINGLFQESPKIFDKHLRSTFPWLAIDLLPLEFKHLWYNAFEDALMTMHEVYQGQGQEDD